MLAVYLSKMWTKLQNPWSISSSALQSDKENRSNLGLNSRSCVSISTVERNISGRDHSIGYGKTYSSFLADASLAHVETFRFSCAVDGRRRYDRRAPSGLP